MFDCLNKLNYMCRTYTIIRIDKTNNKPRGKEIKQTIEWVVKRNVYTKIGDVKKLAKT